MQITNSGSVTETDPEKAKGAESVEPIDRRALRESKEKSLCTHNKCIIHCTHVLYVWQIIMQKFVCLLSGSQVPYVQVSLVVAGRHVCTKKSARKKHTIDPVWG